MEKKDCEKWYLEWCPIKEATAENFWRTAIWTAEAGSYTDGIDAYNARLMFMQDHPDRYYRVRRAKNE